MNFSLENDFTRVCFEEKDDKVYLKKLTCWGVDYVSLANGSPLSNVFLVGQHGSGRNFCRYAKGCEVLQFVDYKLDKFEDKKVLLIIEKNDKIKVETYFTLFDNSAVLTCSKKIENISLQDYTIECASVINLINVMCYDEKYKNNGNANNVADFNFEFQSNMSFAGAGYESTGLPYLWKAHNSWCQEAVFERFDLTSEGLRAYDRFKRNGKISVVSNGSQSTSRYLPLGIFEREPYGYFMFELTTSGAWSYEIEIGGGDRNDREITLALTGKNLYDNGWFKVLRSGEVYSTEQARLLGGKNLDEIAEHFTYFRRDVRKKFDIKPYEYVIYNNFQQNTYDQPSEENDKIYIKESKECGADYYVVDAGWHDNSLNKISPTQKIGQWEENVGSYPNGFIKSIEMARSNGMKFGLWVELQSIGYFSENKNILPEECFFHINGIRPISNARYQLDYSNEKTREFATSVIDKIIKRYSPDYVKIDYNQTAYGNDSKTGSLVEGLEKHVRAYNEWFDYIQSKYPSVMFESCASGGMSIDPDKARLTNVFSISDCGTYNGYPYILANVCLATLPEQNGIWNMPIRKLFYPSCKWNTENITTDEEVIMNVVNSLYGVMHLSSRLDKISSKQKELLKEGVKYYKSLADIKENATPIFPNGFTLLDDSIVYVGIKSGNKVYLSVYNMTGRKVNVAKDLSKYNVSSVNLAYPSSATNKYRLWREVFECELEPLSARAFEFTVKNK